MPINIYSLLPEAVSEKISAKFPAFRYRQLMHWLYQKHVYQLEEMTDLPANFKQFLKDEFDFSLPSIETIITSTDGTQKFLLKLTDGAFIEMVLIPDKEKRTLCISSQVGCSRACSFCATATLGLKRNLLVEEIVGQILLASSLPDTPRITNLVFMGMGEPMDNLQNVMNTLSIIQHETTLSFSPRRTTISTCGLPVGIRKLADSGIKTKLAISLNSANDEIRDVLMPVNKRFPLSELKQAILYYLKKSSFRVTLEYILIPEINMSPNDIKALRRFAGDLSCKINFIPYNPVPDLPYRRPTSEEIEAFLKKAMSLNQAITLRKSRGSEIAGACGQLAGTHKNKLKIEN